MENKTVAAKNHSFTRRGTNTRQSNQTLADEAAAASESAVESIAGKGSGTGTEAGSSGLPTAASDSGPGTARSGSGFGAGGSNAISVLGGEDEDGVEPGAGEEVATGTLIGAPDELAGKLHFGAPGLHGAGIEKDEEGATGIAIGFAALLVGLIGWGWEHRRQEVLV